MSASQQRFNHFAGVLGMALDRPHVSLFVEPLDGTERVGHCDFNAVERARHLVDNVPVHLHDIDAVLETRQDGRAGVRELQRHDTHFPPHLVGPDPCAKRARQRLMPETDPDDTDGRLRGDTLAKEVDQRTDPIGPFVVRVVPRTGHEHGVGPPRVCEVRQVRGVVHNVDGIDRQVLAAVATEQRREDVAVGAVTV